MPTTVAYDEMEQRKTTPIRIAVYLILGPLFILSLAANLYLYRYEKWYVITRPVDSYVLYSAAQVGVARGYLDVEAPSKISYLEHHLARELVLPALSSTFEKIEALGTYLLSIAQPHEGLPSPPVSSINGLEVFAEVLEGKVNVWSDLISRVYVTLANASGVPSRLVHVANSIHGTAHWFAESYVAEQDRWTFVDLRYRKLYVEDWTGEAISGAELMVAVEKGRTDHLEVALFEGGGVVHRPYAEHAASEKYFFSPGAVLRFPTPSELRPSALNYLRAYLYSPSKVFTLDWTPFLRWRWMKTGLLSATAIFGISLVGLLVSDFRR